MNIDIPVAELTEADRELVETAREIADTHSDGEDGIHTVGAAVRAADGSVHRGINVYHFTGGPCAELVALGAARANGARELTTIVAVGNGDRGVLGPCGRDRQILLDHHPGIRVVLPTSHGLATAPVHALLPFATTWSTTEASVPFTP
ncbi:cytidine deaminase [Streptomyces albiaxialis]|uniref:Cytidine deaminase n=1 Tax=Streptomyces albiaxialis TaxID=329523 RepID=A0ABN2VPE1_9ACTN